MYPDEAGLNESPHLDLSCLKVKFFILCVFKDIYEKAMGQGIYSKYE